MLRLLIKILSFMLIFFSISIHNQTEGKVFGMPADTELRGVWVSTVLNLDFPSKAGISTEQMKTEILSILDRSVDIGLNAVFLQVRPAGDAFYNSELFPWSRYLSGTQGQAPSNGFDPLDFWIAAAHERGLELHAWLNPYRVSHSTHKLTDVNLLSEDNPARLNPSWTKTYTDGGIYFDPGIPEVRQLILDGVAEILNKYDVDGIHLDDYFYPGVDFPDETSYQTYSRGMNKEDWRRDNVNILIRDIQSIVKAINPNARFGVSPFAIWQNLSSSPLGSDTNGMESYGTLYSDTRKWVKEGWLDYICPQIYWYINYPIADYIKVLDWWIDVCDGTDVDLYVGHAAYKEAQGAAEWNGQILEQLRVNERSQSVAGSIFFRFLHINGSLGNQIKSFYSAGYVTEPSQPIIASVKPLEALYPLAVRQPSGAVSTNGNGYFIMGTCNPNNVLYMNGIPVETRTDEGFFGAYVKLEVGDNVIKFEQDGSEPVTRVITKKPPATPAAPVTTVANPKITEAFPTNTEYRSEGDTVTFKCRAPKGAEVWAIINNSEYAMTESQAGFADGTAIYEYGYIIPEASVSGMIIDIGGARYRMKYNGIDYAANAEGTIKCITKNTPYYATVISNSAWVYPNATTDNGSSWQMVRGQKDAITAITGDGSWIKLATGQWIQKSNVSCVQEDALISNQIYDASYIQSSNSDIIKLKSDISPAINASYNGTKLIVKFALTSDLPWLMITDDSIFDSIMVTAESNTASYIFTLKEGARIEGYYTIIDDEGIKLHINKHKRISDGNLPLEGFKFVIDAGHGKDESGALGPLGAAIGEKDINLSNALKLSERLKKLGATIIMVRETDVYYSLYERTEISRAEYPDLFISMHANSVDVTTDATNINGLTVWYRNENSREFAAFLMDKIRNINPLTNRRNQADQANFYVCRPVWTPSVIVEASFMCNPFDFSWLINSQRQDELADAIANSILAYYGG